MSSVLRLLYIQVSIWGAGLEQDYQVATAPSGEPLITSMGLDQETPTMEILFEPAGGSAYDLWQLHKKKRDLRQEHLEYWLASASLTGTGRPVDAIISPVAAYPAPPHGKNR